MCLGKITIRCPNCKQPQAVARPDSNHPCWSLEKPQDKDVADDLVAQVYRCKNPSCNTKFTVYWYETQMFIDRT